jgi:hypothetical protein
MMNRIGRRGAIAIACACALLPALAWADGFAELRAALGRSQGATAIKGSAKVEAWSRDGDGKDAEEDQGQASLGFEDGPQGLRLTYPRDLLARVDVEARAREKDPKAKAPASAGLKSLAPADLRGLLAPAPSLLSLLDDCMPKGESVEAWNGRPARRLSCEFGIDRLKGRDRKYVKTFDGKLDIWIAADGTPLASRGRTAVSGRAFVVVGFESASDHEQSFQTVGDRLVVVREERRSSGSGAGEKGESRVVRELMVQP